MSDGTNEAGATKVYDAGDFNKLLKEATDGLSEEALAGMDPYQIVRAYQTWKWLYRVGQPSVPETEAPEQPEATLADVDAAIARDVQAEAEDLMRRAMELCEKHDIDPELVIRKFYP